MTLPIISSEGQDTWSYGFDLTSGPVTVHVDLRRAESAEPGAPAWAALEHKKCSNCPLSGRATCPAAVDLQPVVEALGSVRSVEEVAVTVTHGRRETKQSVTGEAAARALTGIILASSGCPILNRLRPLALLHLPFATPMESTFRFAANHVLGQFFEGKPMDLGTLQNQMEDLFVVNSALAARIKPACRGDAIPNALTALFSLSAVVSDEAELGLAGLRELFTR